MKKIYSLVKEHAINLRSEVKYNLTSTAFKYKQFKSGNNIIICSETRGGGTWLMEILSKSPKCVVFWEPLHKNNGILDPTYNLGWRPYIPENDTNSEYKEIFSSVLSAKYTNKWTLRYAGFMDSIIAEKLLIKFGRANLILPWMAKNFKFKYKPIFLIRHPIAVAMSQIRAFHQDKSKQKFSIPDSVNNDRYIMHKDFMESLQTQLELQVALWCLHNQDTISHPNNQISWLPVYYEKLVLDPISELNRIRQELNIDLPDLLKLNLRQRSKTDYKNDLIDIPAEQLSKWKQQLSVDQLISIQGILEYFNVSIYSIDDFLPIFK